MTDQVSSGGCRSSIEPGFAGRIGRTVAESTPWWPEPTRPPAGAPNVVVIVLDDVGYAHLGSYGSSIRTPAMDALAADGVRYSNFHAAALCSPSRASLLTGRNHHAVGVGFLADFDSGYPGYRGAISPAAATVAEILGSAGVGCYASGKWHLTPPAHMTPAGPFGQWPTGRGFDRYYGFLWGEDDQYEPELWRDNQRAEPSDDPEYHLSEDLVDQAQQFIADHVSADPFRPFFTYLAFGACHAPHQAPRRYIDAYRGAFDHGWDEERSRVLARQKELGLVPDDTELPPANDDVRPWSELSADEQRLAARMNEVFAGFMTHTDDQIARLLEFLRRNDLEENTLVVLLADNGASGEGGPYGSANEYRYFLNLEDSFENTLAAIDDLGGPDAHNHFPAGWAQAGNTPLKMYKKFTFGGGIRVPCIVRWPAGIAARGEVRHQFHHVSDLTPTILEAYGLEAPTVYRGVEQLPMTGTSMRYSFDDADAPTAKRTQYFETAGHRGLVHEGLKVVANHEPGTAFDADTFELYDLRTDFSETRDLASERPDDVARLVELWWREAEANQVLPLDDRMQTRVQTRDPANGREAYRLLPGARLSNGPAGPEFADRGFSLVAALDDAQDRGDGVLLAYGRRAAGFVLYVSDDVLTFDLNLAGQHVLVTSPPLPQKVAELSVELRPVPSGGLITLSVDGAEVARARSPRLVPAGLGCFTTQAGHNTPSPVSSAYQRPFAFGAALRHVDVLMGARVPQAESHRAFAANGSE